MTAVRVRAKTVQIRDIGDGVLSLANMSINLADLPPWMRSISPRQTKSRSARSACHVFGGPISGR